MGQLNPFFAMVEQYKVDLSAIFILSVSHTITLKRLTSRLSCPRCGAIYNTYFNPPQKGEICNRCGARLRRRRDDRLETVNKRALEYEDQTVPVIKYFRNHHPNITYELNGDREQADITEFVLSVLGGRGVLLDGWREDSKGTESSQSTDE
jgi:adenylate kinase